MSPTRLDEHVEFRRLLPDHLLDLLVDDERERFEAHARACPDCGNLLSAALAARSDWWDGAAHPPVSVLATWGGSPGSPPSPPNPMDPASVRAAYVVTAHLAECESCRAEVEELRGPGALIALAPAPAPRRRPMHFRWLPAVGGAAGLAAAVVAMWVVNRSTGPAPVAPPAPAETPRSAAPASPEPAAPAAPAPGPAAPREVVAGPFELLAATRGESEAVTVVSLPAGATRARLTLPMLPVPTGAAVTVELLGADGAPAWTQVLPAGRARDPGAVVLPAGRLVAGRQVLRVRWPGLAAGEPPREYLLDVRMSP